MQEGIRNMFKDIIKGIREDIKDGIRDDIKGDDIAKALGHMDKDS